MRKPTKQEWVEHGMIAFEKWESEKYPDGTPLSDADARLWEEGFGVGYEYALQTFKEKENK
jgi:hypothetical protein